MKIVEEFPQVTRTARFSMNEEAVVRKKTRTCNEETLVVKLEKEII